MTAVSFSRLFMFFIVSSHASLCDMLCYYGPMLFITSKRRSPLVSIVFVGSLIHTIARTLSMNQYIASLLRVRVHSASWRFSSSGMRDLLLVRRSSSTQVRYSRASMRWSGSARLWRYLTVSNLSDASHLTSSISFQTHSCVEQASSSFMSHLFPSPSAETSGDA